MPRLGAYLDNVLAQATGRFVTAVASLGVTVLVARLLGVEEYGRFAYVLVYLAVTIGLAEFGTNSILARELATRQDVASYWGTFVLVRLGLCAVVAGVAIPAAWFLNRDLFVYLAPCLLGLPFLASRFFEPVFQAFQRPWYSALASCVYGAVALLGCLMALRFSKGLGAVLAAYLLANVVYTFWALELAGKLVPLQIRWSRDAALALLRSAAPLGIGSLISVVNSRADVFLLNRLGSVYDVGIYSAAYRVLELAGVIAIVLMNPSIQIFAAEAEDRTRLRATFSKTLTALGCVTLPVAILVPHVSRPLIAVVFGPRFAASADVLNVLAWVGALVFFFLFSFSVCVAIDAVRFGMAITAIAAALNLALNALWVPKHGYLGTAWARLASDMVLTGGSLGYVQARIGPILDGIAWLKLLSLSAALWLLSAAASGMGVLGLAISVAAYCAGIVALRVFPTELLTLGRKSSGV